MSDAAAIAVLVFAAALLQASLVSSLDVLGGTADVLLLVLIGIASPISSAERQSQKPMSETITTRTIAS